MRFPFFKAYPGTNLHEIDLDYVLSESDATYSLASELKTWADAHEREYEVLANKVEGLINNLVDVIRPWDSSIEYPIYSIVEYQGTNYIAVQPVPVGAMITNTEYWQPANTIVEQINAIGATITEVAKRVTFTTPEYYGAVGDGVTDDTAAWQAALDSGFPVFALHSQYKTDTLTLSSGHHVVDFNGASFTTDSPVWLDCRGAITESVSAPDYAANTKHYSPTSMTGYTGYAFVRGTNNFEPARTYYKGGITAHFTNGAMDCNPPIDITGVTIDKFEPVSGTLSNLGNITHTAIPSPVTAGRGISILHGANLHITGCNITKANVYAVIDIVESTFCTVSDSVLCDLYRSPGDNSYNVIINGSSFISILRCNMANANWHCISTGGEYLCYCNTIEGCALSSDYTFSIGGHENEYGTRVINNVVKCGMFVAAGAVVENNIITSGNVTNGTALIEVFPCSILRNARYTIRGNRFTPDKSSAQNYVAVSIYCSPQVSGNTYYINDLHIEDCQSDEGYGFQCTLNVAATATVYLYDIHVINCNFDILFAKQATVDYINIDNYNLFITGAKSHQPFASTGAPYYINIGRNNYVFNNVIIRGGAVRYMQGTFNDVYLYGVKTAQNLGGTGVTINGHLLADTLPFPFEKAAMASATYVAIGVMVDKTETYYNVYKRGSLYYRSRYSGGALITETF